MYHTFASYYDELMNLDYDGYFKILSSMVDLKNKDILEVGCGTGQMTRRILKPSRSVVAVDVSEEMLAIARESLQDPRLSFHLLEDKLPFSKNFDVILAPIDVYHYLDPLALEEHLGDVSNHLQEGGSLLFDLREDLEGLEEDMSYDVGEDLDFFWLNQWDPKEEALQMDFYFYRREGNLFKREIESQTLYKHPLERLTQSLQRAGLKLVDTTTFDGRVIIKATK